MKLSILIPVYNDKNYIKQTIDQIRAVQFPIPYEIVAVDDASTDGSKEILEAIPNIVKIFHTKNTGKGGAIATGLQHVTGDIIAIQDDDCEYDPAVLPSLIEPILRGEADVVYGSRFLKKNTMFFIQRLENMAITTLANILIGEQLSDIETGHKVFSRTMAQKIQLTKKGFEFDMEITLQFLQHHARIKELPTRYSARTHAQGKKITYKDGIRSILTLFKMAPKKQIKKILLYIAFIATVFSVRLIDLGTILTVDEPLWLTRGQTFINALSVGNFEKTLVAGQPGITTAWLIGLSSPWHSLFTAQMAIAIMSSVLILINTYFFRIMFGNKWGIITGLFLALDPFLLAHSRVAHTDALLALFYLAALTSLLCGLTATRIQRRYVIFSAFLAAGAILTKIFGIILIPTALCIIGITLWKRKEPLVRIASIATTWLSICLIVIFLAWPALWTHSSTVYNLLSSSAQRHGEGSRIQEVSSSSWYYMRELLFRSSIPVALLLPFSIWQWRNIKKSKHSAITLSLVAAGVLFVAVLNIGSDKGDRYALFAHTTLIVAAPLGLRGIVKEMKKKSSRKKWIAFAIALPVAYLAIDTIRLHPYYLAHYNRLYPIETTHKLGWGEGLEQAATWIHQHHPGAKVLTYYPRVFTYFYPGEVGTITHIDDAQADFAVLYRSMLERGDDSPETDLVNQFLFSDKKPEHIIVINGLPYVWIFPL